MTRRPLAALLLVTCGSAVTACALILGLEHAPVADAAATDVEAEVPVDAGADGCAPRGDTFCQSLCPEPDFCDDFDDDAGYSRWDNPFASNPVTSPDATALIDGGHFVSESDGGATGEAYAVLVHALNAERGRGVRVRMRFRVRVLELPQGFEGSVADGGSVATVLGIGDATGRGVGVTFTTDSTRQTLRISLAQRDVLRGRGRGDEIAAVYKGAPAPLTSGWLGLDLVVGPAELLATLDRTCVLDDGGTVAPSTVVAHALSFAAPACGATFDTLATPAWLEAPGLVVGAFVNGGGRLALEIDGVAANVFR